MGVFVVSPHPGLLVPGNIDLANRPFVRNRDGSISTIRSIGFDLPVDMQSAKLRARTGGRVAQVLVPSVVGHRVVSDRAAWDQFARTGRHLGILDTIAHSNAYANVLHLWEAKNYKPTKRNLKKTGSRI